MSGWFVTGTDTAVGKTVVAAALCRLQTDAGRPVVYAKPVQSGADRGDDDAGVVGDLAGVPTVTGAVLGPALAPAVAARRADRQLTADDLAGTVEQAAGPHPGTVTVVEGAGGLTVELGTDGTTCADLAARLGRPLVVVARPGLGTLNHTVLTLREADRRGLPVAGVVVCGYPDDPDPATATNLGELARLTGDRLAGVLPELDLDGPDPLAGVADHLGPGLGGGWTPPGPAGVRPPRRH